MTTLCNTSQSWQFDFRRWQNIWIIYPNMQIPWPKTLLQTTFYRLAWSNCVSYEHLGRYKGICKPSLAGTKNVYEALRVYNTKHWPNDETKACLLLPQGNFESQGLRVTSPLWRHVRTSQEKSRKQRGVPLNQKEIALSEGMQKNVYISIYIYMYVYWLLEFPEVIGTCRNKSSDVTCALSQVAL